MKQGRGLAVSKRAMEVGTAIVLPIGLLSRPDEGFTSLIIKTEPAPPQINPDSYLDLLHRRGALAVEGVMVAGGFFW